MNSLSRRQQFRNHIRKTQIDEIKRRLRIQADSQLTIHEIASFLKLDPNLAYTLENLLDLRKKCLCSPPLHAHKIQEEQQLGIQIHIRFWKYLSQNLNKCEENWSDKIWTILFEILNGFSYQQIHHCVGYQVHFLNTLQLACERISSENKIKVMSWVAGVEGLRVIESCLTNGHFLDCDEHSRVYRIIELGLKSQLRQENEQAAHVLAKILQGADWDDAYKIYERFHGLMIHLCCKIQRYYIEGLTKSYTLALNLLLDCYDQVVIDYARSGAAYSAALLISSPHPESQAEGLNLLRTMSQIGSSRMVELLLTNRDIETCRLFQRLFTRVFTRNPSCNVRQLFHSLLENLLANSEKEQTEEINRKFGADYQDIFELLSESLRQQQEKLIIKSVINSLKSLAYYGQREYQPNELLPLLEIRQILKGLEAVAHSEVHSSQVGQLAIQLLNQLHHTI